MEKKNSPNFVVYPTNWAPLTRWVRDPLDHLGSLLLRCTLYVWSTLADGDSILVKETLAKRVQVVASDIVLRPKGVETYPVSER
jgi:hypothetical protein